jgi:hypothetical protein
MNSGLIKEQAKEAFSNALAVGKKYAGELAESEDFFKPIVMAMAIKDLRDALTPEAMSAVKELAGTSLGFMTDRKPNDQYSIDVIRECVVEAMIRGVGVVGNQFNIIASRFYMARNGWEAKLRKAGCTQIVPTVGKPDEIREGKANNNGFAKFTATFGAQATCIKGGQRYSVSACVADGIDGRIEASAFGKDMSDCLPGMKGKVEARILKKLYCLACDAIESDDEEQDRVIIIEEPHTTDAVITQQPEQEEMTDLQRQRKLIVGQFERLRKMVADNADHLSFFNDSTSELEAAKTEEQINLIRDAMNARRKEMKPISKPVADELKRFVDLRIEELKGGAA